MTEKKENISEHSNTYADKNIGTNEDEQKGGIGLVLCCMDHRFIDHTTNFLKNDTSVHAYDYITLSGASLGYNSNNECWKNTFLEHIDIAIKLNNIVKIIVIDHEDCGAYQLHYKDIINDPDLEEEYHYINMLEFKKNIKKLYPHLPIFTHLLKLT
jgi:carbonic anhydrase